MPPTTSGACVVRAIERMACLKAEIVFNKWRGRFRPDDEIGMRGIRRAGDFARWRAGLRNAGDVRFALFAGQAREFRDMAIPLRAPPVVACAHIEIRLNQNGSSSGVGNRRRNRPSRRNRR